MEFATKVLQYLPGIRDEAKAARRQMDRELINATSTSPSLRSLAPESRNPRYFMMAVKVSSKNQRWWNRSRGHLSHLTTTRPQTRTVLSAK